MGLKKVQKKVRLLFKVLRKIPKKVFSLQKVQKRELQKALFADRNLYGYIRKQTIPSQKKQDGFILTEAAQDFLLSHTAQTKGPTFGQVWQSSDRVGILFSNLFLCFLFCAQVRLMCSQIGGSQSGSPTQMLQRQVRRGPVQVVARPS